MIQKEFTLHDSDPDEERRARLALASMVVADDVDDEEKVVELDELLQMVGLK